MHDDPADHSADRPDDQPNDRSADRPESELGNAPSKRPLGRDAGDEQRSDRTPESHEVHIEPLSDEERAWMNDQRETLMGLIEELGLSLGEDASVLDAGDELIKWWHRQPEPERPDPEAIIAIAGIAVGDCLVESYGMEWGIISDDDGTDLALYHAEQNLVCHPTESVNEQFAEGKDGFLVELFNSLCDGLDEAIDHQD